MADESPRGDQPRVQTAQLNSERNGANLEYRVSSNRTSTQRPDTRRMERS